jgi:hypothetical protein
MPDKKLLYSFDNGFSRPITVQIPVAKSDLDLGFATLELEQSWSSKQSYRQYDDYTQELKDELKDAHLHRRLIYGMVHQLEKERAFKGFGDSFDLISVRAPGCGIWRLK